jgi:hypothetical protein
VKIIILILTIVWQLPQNLVAVLMLPFLGKINFVYSQRFCWIFECSKMQGAISLGNFIFLSKISETTIQHELGHVQQSHILGWLYLFIIGIPSILNSAFHFTDCYYNFYTEKWANKLSKLKCKNCKLFK